MLDASVCQGHFAGVLLVHQHGHGTLLKGSLLVLCLQDDSENHVNQLYVTWGDHLHQMDGLETHVVQFEEIVLDLCFEMVPWGVVQMDL